jgi:acetyl/propionyl-CoA carboxylase alpha subunit
VPVEYDPLLAKLSVWDESRANAIERMRRAVSEYCILGITTNLRLFEKIFASSAFKSGALDTGFLEQFMKERQASPADPASLVAAVLAAACAGGQRPQSSQTMDNGTPALWRTLGRRELVR